MPIPRYYLSDFLEIQRKSFFELLEKGLIEEFSKRNPITNSKKNIELFFYPEYYKLTQPEYNPIEAIFKAKSYTSKLYIPVQLTDQKFKLIKLKWVYIGNLPLMTKRGHFILNGAPRVIVNQILRSPGIYYQKKVYENFNSKWDQKPEGFFLRYYADLICQRGTWLRLEIDKEKNIWAQMKKGPKIPILWLLIAMGLTEAIIFKSISDSSRLLQNLENFDSEKPEKKIFNYVKSPPQAWKELYNIISGSSFSLAGVVSRRESKATTKLPKVRDAKKTLIGSLASLEQKPLGTSLAGESTLPKVRDAKLETSLAGVGSATKLAKLTGGRFASIPLPSVAEQGLPPVAKRFTAPFAEQGKQTESVLEKVKKKETKKFPTSVAKLTVGKKEKMKKKAKKTTTTLKEIISLEELGRKWFFNKFMNPRSYDLGKHGRYNFNRKLGLSISLTHTTLTPQDLLYATDYLIKVEKGFKKVDDIDHLKNRRVRTSGELLQIQLGTGLVRLEKTIRDKMTKLQTASSPFLRQKKKLPILQPVNYLSSFDSLPGGKAKPPVMTNARLPSGDEEKIITTTLSTEGTQTTALASLGKVCFATGGKQAKDKKTIQQKIFTKKKDGTFQEKLTISNLMNTKAFNGTLREFFGSSPLSQFMDQINPLSELTHKRRLSSMGPGGVTRDTATLVIRGIHPTHYGRICPVETPEGKNTGLVNSMTTFARVNPQGFLESPFYKVYKGQVQKRTGLYYLSAEQEEKIKLAAADLSISNLGFLPKSTIPVRISEDFTKIPRKNVEYIGVSPIQMISIATSLIPFLEHDDANRALMGSNMQRQAVPLMRPERPIVGTGLEGRVVSDSGHALQVKSSGFVQYVSNKKIIVLEIA